MSKDKSKKVLFVDFLRVLACIIVICCHCKFCLPGSNNTISKIFLACITADGVAIFWMIMGMFYFRDIPYKVRLKKLFKRVVIPIIIISVFIFYFNDYLLGNKSLLGSIQHPLNDYIDLIRNNILVWEPLIDVGHLWYLYVYILLVLLFPILNKIREYIDTIDYKKVLIFFYILLLFNDISLNKLFLFSFHAFNGVFASLACFYTGYILHKNDDKLDNKSLIKYFLIFVFVNLIRMIFTYIVMKGDPSNRELLKWYSSFGLIVVICLYMITRNIFIRINVNKISEKILLHFSKLTFYIYLVHCTVIRIIDSRGINIFLLQKFNNHVVYFCVYTLIVFIISFIISEFILLLIRLYNKLFSKRKKKI